MTYDPLKHLTDSAETLHLMAQLMEHDLKHWHEIEPRDHMVLLDARAHRLREASQVISSAAKMLGMAQEVPGHADGQGRAATVARLGPGIHWVGTGGGLVEDGESITEARLNPGTDGGGK